MRVKKLKYNKGGLWEGLDLRRGQRASSSRRERKSPMSSSCFSRLFAASRNSRS